MSSKVSQLKYVGAIITAGPRCVPEIKNSTNQEVLELGDEKYLM